MRFHGVRDPSSGTGTGEHTGSPHWTEEWVRSAGATGPGHGAGLVHWVSQWGRGTEKAVKPEREQQGGRAPGAPAQMGQDGPADLEGRRGRPLLPPQKLSH